jgi:hypothetical protein
MSFKWIASDFLDKMTAIGAVAGGIVALGSGLVLVALYGLSGGRGAGTEGLSSALFRAISIFSEIGFLESFLAGLLGLLLAAFRTAIRVPVPEADWLAARAAVYACLAWSILQFAGGMCAR